MGTSVSKKVIYAVLLVSLISLALITAGIIYNNSIKGKLFAYKLIEQKETVFKGYLDDHIEEAKNKLIAIENMPSVVELVKDKNNQIAKSRLEDIFKTFLISFPHYSQLRLVSYDQAYGEILRVNRLPNNQIVVADEGTSFPEVGRYYLEEARSLSRGQFYISDIDLNKEGKEISVPYILTLRVVKPLIIDKKRRTFLIINMDMMRVLKSLKSKLRIKNDFELRDSLDRILMTTKEGGNIPFDGFKWPIGEDEYEREWKHFNYNKNTHYYFYINHDLFSDGVDNLFFELVPSIFLIVLTCLTIYYVLNANVVKPIEKMNSYVSGVETALNITDPQTRKFKSTNKSDELKGLDETLRRLVNRLLSQNHKIEEQGRFLNSVALYYRANKLGNLTYVNSNFVSISGYQREELLGKNMKLLNSGKHDKKFWKNFWNTVSQGDEWKGHVWNKNKYGDIFVLDTTVMPIKNELGEVIEYVGVSFDITEEVRTKEKLSVAKASAEKADKSKSAFLANMSHEIRTPMNGIIGMIEMLKSSIDRPDQLKQLEVLESSGNSLLEIINNILDFSKIEAGAMKPKISEFNLKEVIEDRLSLVKPLALKKGLELNCTLDEDFPENVKSDPQFIGQVINNLLNNAIKFTDSGKVELRGSVISNKKEKTKLEISVVDTGIGIPKSHQKLLFKEFQQVDDISNRNYQGTGLGLAISKSLARELAGNITFESEQGKGTTFFFNLEVEELETRDNIKKEIETEMRVTSPQHGKLNIMIVDDNEINQFVTKSFIEKLDCNVFLASSGSQAIETLNNLNCDVVLMDCHMPGMDGYETTQKIIQNLGDARPKIIGFSASVLQEDVEKCYEAGMDEFLSKPVKLKDVKRVLAKLNILH